MLNFSPLTETTSVNDVIYHYTTAAGILGILENSCIWATHTSFLNDTDEQRISFRLFREVLDSVAIDKGLSEDIRKFAKTVLQYFDSTTQIEADSLTSQIGMQPRAFFVTCFSRRRDDLAQWRAYTGMGPRFSIGFRKSAFTELERVHDARLANVWYDNKIVSQGIRSRFLQVAATWLPKLIGSDIHTKRIEDLHPPLVYDLSHAMFAGIAPLTKHEKFQAEEECRLYLPAVHRNGEKNTLPFVFRTGVRTLVPYLAVPFADIESAIESITVGPTPHMNEAVAATKLLVASFRKDGSRYFPGRHPIVEPSEVPYRDW
jgi:Protein of unknown function (DUF2971)